MKAPSVEDAVPDDDLLRAPAEPRRSRAERLASRHAGKAEYQKRTTRHDESQFEMLKKLELDEKAHLEGWMKARAAALAKANMPNGFDQ